MTGNIRIFRQSHWVKDPTWPEGHRPESGVRKTVKYVETEQEAREYCVPRNEERVKMTEPFFEFSSK